MQAPACRKFPQLSATFRNRLSLAYCSSSVHPCGGGGGGKDDLVLAFLYFSRGRYPSLPLSLSLSLSLCPSARARPFRNLLCPERSKFPRTDHEQYAADGRNDGFSLISRVLCRVAFIRPELFARLRIIGERNASWDSSEPNALKRSPNRVVLSTLR